MRNLAFPLLFVFLWSTGFIGAKFGLPSAEPFTFLCVRMFLTLLIMTLLLPLFPVKWPTRLPDYGHLAIVGILIHGIYLGGVFTAIYRGLPSSIAAVVVGLQPLVTVALSRIWLGESMTTLKLAGLITGFAGIVLVVSEQGLSSTGINTPGLAFSAAALLGISVGTIYQKKFCTKVDLLPGVFVQYSANALFMLALALLLESREIHWNLQFTLALSWLIVALSLGAVLLLMWLIRHGEAGKVASLFYLVPPLVAVEAWLLFGERFGLIAIIGIACCIFGVAMVMHETRRE
jgi:drug/metabolite transporter (DMT)-like permease